MKISEAFKLGYDSQLGDAVPPLMGASREAWYVGAYFMRASFPLPRRIERGPYRDGKITIFADGELYINEPCDVGTKTSKI